MDFMRDFPDDATCLDWLWRTRYAAALQGYSMDPFARDDSRAQA